MNLDLDPKIYGYLTLNFSVYECICESTYPRYYCIAGNAGKRQLVLQILGLDST